MLQNQETLRLLLLETLANPNVNVAADSRAGVALNGAFWYILLRVVAGSATRKHHYDGGHD
jgi:hypothetical protein